MGFLTGRVQFVRYKVKGKAYKTFDNDHLERLASKAIGQARVISADGVDVGWTAGDHLLDTRFDLEKNVINDALHFAFRIDQLKLPGDLLRAYTQVEMEGIAAGNPSGKISAKQKREAREAAKARLEEEAKDGRFLQRRTHSLMWDAPSNELLVASTAQGAIDRLVTLFQQTFGSGFEIQGAGARAYDLAELREQTRGVDDATPTIFVTGGSAKELAWAPDENSRDFLGNEFLLWLWYVLETEGDTIKLADESEIVIMLARSLVLECPRGQTGKETITSDAPNKLPEARRAVQSGKLPRKAGLTIVRHDQAYELTLHAENLGVSAAKMPAIDEPDDRARIEERITQIRHLTESLDLLYDVFGRRRLISDWSKETTRMRKWLADTE
ncbi:hypothetical protein BH10PLA2_BH10PLA2_17840 [soil metagenome]